MSNRNAPSRPRRLGAKQRAGRHGAAQQRRDSDRPGSNLRRRRSISSATRKEVKKFWFHRVSYGLGFTPASKEGWAIVILHLALVFLWAMLLLRGHTDDEMRFIWFVTIFFCQTGLLMWIARRKGTQ